LVEYHCCLQGFRNIDQMLDRGFIPLTMVMVLLSPPCLKTGT